MSGKFSQFDNAVEEFRRGITNELNDRKPKMISAQDEIDVNDPSSQGMFENFCIIPARKKRLKVSNNT